MTNFPVGPESGAIIRFYRPVAELEVKLKVPCWLELLVHSNYPQNHIFHGSTLPGCLCCHHGASVPAEAGPGGTSGLCDSQCPPPRCLPHAFIAGAVNHYART